MSSVFAWGDEEILFANSSGQVTVFAEFMSSANRVWQNKEKDKNRNILFLFFISKYLTITSLKNVQKLRNMQWYLLCYSCKKYRAMIISSAALFRYISLT